MSHFLKFISQVQSVNKDSLILFLATAGVNHHVCLWNPYVISKPVGVKFLQVVFSRIANYWVKWPSSKMVQDNDNFNRQFYLKSVNTCIIDGKRKSHHIVEIPFMSVFLLFCEFSIVLWYSITALPYFLWCCVSRFSEVICKVLFQ